MTDADAVRPASNAYDTAKRALDAVEHWGFIRPDGEWQASNDDCGAAFDVMSAALDCLDALRAEMGLPRFLAALDAVERFTPYAYDWQHDGGVLVAVEPCQELLCLSN